jgi:DNA polymerase I
MPRFRLDLPEPEIVDTPEGVQALVDDMMSSPGPVAYDTETSGLEWAVVCYLIALAYRSPVHGSRRLVVPVIHPQQYQFFDLLQPWFESTNCSKIAHNAPYDYRVMKRHQIQVNNVIADTMKMHHLIDEEERHDLKTLAKNILHLNLLAFTKVFDIKPGGKVRDKVKEVFDDPERRPRAVEYATLDAWATLELYEYFREILEDEEWNTPEEYLPDPPHNYWDLHQVFDMPLNTVLQKYAQRGVLVDVGYLESQDAPMKRRLVEITQRICESTNSPVNPGSDAQIRKLLFEDLGLKGTIRTAKGAYSVKREVLEDIQADGHQVATDILIYRDLKKLHSTYIVGLQKAVQADSRVHGSLLHTTVSGRLRMSSPNLQNIPARSEEGKRIRRAFIAPENHVLLCRDYSGLEMRIAAALFGDEGMIEDIFAGRDLHALTASMMYNLDYEEIIEAKKADNPTQHQNYLVNCRTAAKRTGFGINYGVGPAKLASQISQETGIATTRTEGEQLIELYFQVRPGIQEGIERYKREVFQNGFITTILGRKRRPGGIYDSNWSSRLRAERQSINTPIQGTAADLITLAMIQIEEDEELRRMGVRTVLQVHDELAAECPEKYAEEADARYGQIMDNPIGWPGLPFDVPIESDGGWAREWANAKP